MTESLRTAARRPAPSGVAILGAGPVGLEAALAAADAGWPFTVYESAECAGGNVAQWAHVRMFTPWSLNVSERMACHLRSAGRRPPEGDGDCPTGSQLVAELLEPLATLPEVAGRIHYGSRILNVGREGLLKHEEIGSEERAARPFRILVRRGDGTTSTTSASLVLDCTGNYATPNAAGDGGVPAPGEDGLGDRIVRRMPDLARERHLWAGCAILLIGAGWSAQTTARELAELVPSAPGTEVIWAVRHANPNWGEVADDPLAARQALVKSSRRIAAGLVPGIRMEFGVSVDSFDWDGDRILVRLRGAGRKEVRVDRVLALTGFVPDASLYRQLQVHECYATSAPMGLAAQLLGDAGANCLEPSGYGVDVLRNPEPNFFLLGAKSYGRNSEFLMRAGYEQVREVGNSDEPAND